MHKLKAFIYSLLLVITPSFLVYPQDTSLIPQKLNLEEKRTESILSYDEIMYLLNEIESGELEKRSTSEDLEKINHFLALLAKEGILPDESEEDLSDDVEELLNADNPYKYVFSLDASSYMVVSDIFIPGALAKAVSKGVKGAQELGAIYKGLQAAEKTLLLESVTGLESAKIAEVIQTKTAAIAEKLGFNAREIAQLENFGKIEGSINNVINTTPRAVQDISFSKHALQEIY
ncbi:hypothetical protein [Candidatus Rhabdochlamydia sp. T3358]|uniref:hypothetical protein n=1 Tax=Candidatus Rhabdochlamydia sp. T3358 TaxID=2099795 RepID=UPI0010B1094F|nr:hypothetical protein [Candidatus Rhabdochlamydia sp. T3358]VHO02690.1 hypothetical protein RHT_00627 [Candidatus Rhabdochlamydia sp. T3358]